ncbi:hypothetical protein VP382E491_P0045 [Vibrio phage 382E49-1]|nr:hypothetical protein VP141O351_P0044 [Vibrio phage 141O35-1]CAH9015418.1 hypothetical protein VP141E351_P0043 [Vibrio phage 141E35-1]CAH9016127.1 hypothetical protein VP382E491_P0045 [Vibrio phage 382E49-1]
MFVIGVIRKAPCNSMTLNIHSTVTSVNVFSS